MAPTIDGSTIKDQEAVPDGEYSARFTAFTNKKAKSDNSDNINFEFTIDEGEFAGRKQFMTKNLKPTALWSFKQVAIALGADPEAFAGEFDTDEMLEELKGNECRIVVIINKDGPYAGKNNITEVKGLAYAA